MNGKVKEYLQFLLLMSIMYQGCETMESYCVKFTILYTRAHEANYHFDRAKLGKIACPLAD